MSKLIAIMSNDIPKNQDQTLEIDDKKSTKELEVTQSKSPVLQKEINGPKGLEPTRYGDWESKGRCYDF